MRALLMGFYGQQNLGDDLMLVCLERWLARQGITVTVVSEQPRVVEGQFGLPSVENVPLLGEWAWRDAWFRGKAKSLIRAFREHDALIVGGGDLIREDRGRKLLLYTLEKMFLASALGKRVFLLNAGIGRPSTRIGAGLLGAALRRCERIVVRDERSLDVCRKLHAGKNAVYAPDIVTALPRFLKLPANAQPAGERPYVVIALRSDSNRYGLYDLDEGRISCLALSLDLLIRRLNLDVVFLPFQNSAQGGDNLVHQRVVSRMARREHAVIRPWTSDLVRVAECIEGARCVVAMRLHAAVAAAAFGRPYVLMPYDQKLIELAKQQQHAGELSAADLEGVDTIAPILEDAVINGRAPYVPSLEFWTSGAMRARPDA
jgi:polysaccharide pyruvyl transferase CsaB